MLRRAQAEESRGGVAAIAVVKEERQGQASGGCGRREEAVNSEGADTTK